MRWRFWLFVLGLTSGQYARGGDPFPISTPPAERTAGYTVTVHDLTPTLVWCPPGTFTMGSPKTEEFRDDDEDQVEVTSTKGFWIERTEVTQAQWREVMKTTPWRDKEPSAGETIPEDDQYPVSCVSWQDTMDYCEKLTQRERQAGRLTAEWKYTLPTEAQWEYACRAGTTTAYCFGDDPEKPHGPYDVTAFSVPRDPEAIARLKKLKDPKDWDPAVHVGNIDQYAWYCYNVMHTPLLLGRGEVHAQKVGQKKPNPWGIYDMHGNIGEWCLDWCGHPLAGGKDPVMTKQSIGDCKHSRVNRGGTWRQNYVMCRSAQRNGLWEIVRNDYHGFRIVLVPVAK